MLAPVRPPEVRAPSAYVANAFHEPRDESRFVHLARRNGQDRVARVGIGCLESKSVEPKEKDRTRQRRPLVAIVEWVVLRDSERTSGGALGRSGILVPMLGDRPPERGLEECSVTKPDAAAEVGDQPRVHGEYRRCVDPKKRHGERMETGVTGRPDRARRADERRRRTAEVPPRPSFGPRRRERGGKQTSPSKRSIDARGGLAWQP